MKRGKDRTLFVIDFLSVMKDKQLSRKVETSSIPVLSPVLHVLVMPVLVILRHDFGYLFLRPKSVFFSLVWAFVLFSVYSCFEPARWNANPYVSVFFAFSSVLYLVHLVRSIFAQWGSAPHDQFAGYSALRILGINEAKLFLWAEPILVIAAALVFEIMLRGNSLSQFLGCLAVAMFLKELINRWFEMRKVKQQLDATADAEDTMTRVAQVRGEGGLEVDTPKNSSRKPRQRRERVRISTSKAQVDIEFHAAMLRMLPPYTLENAEANFQSLVKQFYPDEIEQDAESNAELVKMTEARDFFRAHFGDQGE